MKNATFFHSVSFPYFNVEFKSDYKSNNRNLSLLIIILTLIWEGFLRARFEVGEVKFPLKLVRIKQET